MKKHAMGQDGGAFVRTEQIHFLVEVSKVHSLNLASQNLCISVQALSKSMKNLEEELGFKILDSTHRGTYLTEKGQELLNAGLDFIAKIQNIQDGLPTRHVIKGSYPLNCVVGMMETIVPQFMTMFHAYHPMATLEPNAQPYLTIMDDLLNEKYDYSIVFEPVVNGIPQIKWEERFEFVQIRTVRFFCQVAEQHPLAKQEEINLQSMMKYDILVNSVNNLPIYSIADVIKSFDMEKEIKTVPYTALFNELLLGPQAVSLTIGIGTRPFQSKKFKYIPILEKNISVNVGYVKLAKRVLSTESKMMLNFFENYLNSLK